MAVAKPAPPDDRRLAHEAVCERLLGQVLDGRLPAGGPLPSERVLAGTHGANRHAVREAIKRLQQAGLVTVTPGGATRVRDRRTSAGLDLLVAWAALVKGSGNVAYRLAFNTLVAAQLDGPIDPAIHAAEIDDTGAQQALLDAVAEGDGERTAARAAALLERTVEALA